MLRVVLIFTLSIILVKCKECSISKEDGTPIELTNKGEVELASFKKNAVNVGSPLPGINTIGVSLKGVDSLGCDPNTYFKFKQDTPDHITVESNYDFINWDGGNTGICKIKVLFDITDCDGSPSDYIQAKYTVLDVNLNPPVFSELSYSLMVPFPIGKGISLTAAFGKVISVTDADFSTQKMTFEVSGSDAFEVPVAKINSDNKFVTSLRTKSVINLQKAIELTITATDDGTDPATQSSNVTFTIEPDLDNSVPPVPEFSQTYQKVTLDADDLQEGIAVPVSISMKEGLEDIVFSVDPDYFTAELSGTDVKLTLNKAQDFEDKFFESVVITATISYSSSVTTASTVVLIEFTEGTTTSSSSSSSTSSTDSTPGDTDSTGGDTDSTGGDTDSTDDGTGTDTDPTSTAPPSDDGDDDDGENSDVDDPWVAATIVMAVLVVFEAIIIGWGYYRYIYKKSKVIVPTSQGHSNTTSNGGGQLLAPTAVVIDNEKVAPVGKTRKRSMTFTDNDEASRANREADKASLPETDSSGGKSRSSSTMTTESEKNKKILESEDGKKTE